MVSGRSLTGQSTLRRSLKALAPRASQIISIHSVSDENQSANSDELSVLFFCIMYIPNQFISSHRHYGFCEYVLINIVWKNLFTLERF